jgi:hypothetical protein
MEMYYRICHNDSRVMLHSRERVCTYHRVSCFWPGPCRYVTNTRIKFVLVLDEPVPKDEEMRMVRCQPAVRVF